MTKLTSARAAGRALIGAGAITLAIASATAGAAGTIETVITPEMKQMGCTVRLSGRIEPGDPERLAQVLAVAPAIDEGEDRRNYSPAFLYGFPFGTHRLCLNAGGGDLDAALDIALALGGFLDQYANPGVPTAVAAGDRCSGACALIFLAGRYAWSPEDQSYWQVDRILHPRGALGFPALSGDVPLARVIRAIEQGTVAMNTNLLADLVALPPGEALALATIGEASRYAIEVAPIPMDRVLQTPIDALRRNACDNAASALGGRYALRRTGTPGWELRDLIYQDPSRILAFVGSRGGYLGDGPALPAATGFSCVGISSFLTDPAGFFLPADPAAHADAYFEIRDGQYAVIGFFAGEAPGNATSLFDPALDYHVGPVELGPRHMLAPETPLSDL